MARRSQQPGRETLADLIAGGLAHLAGFLLHQLQTDQERLDWLRQRFPDAYPQSRQGALNWLRQSELAAAALNPAGAVARRGTVPVDPGVQPNRNYRYVLRVHWADNNPLTAGTPFETPGWDDHIVYHSNELLTRDQLQARVPSDLRERAARAEARRRHVYATGALLSAMSATVTVLQVVRRSTGV